MKNTRTHIGVAPGLKRLVCHTNLFSIQSITKPQRTQFRSAMNTITWLLSEMALMVTGGVKCMVVHKDTTEIGEASEVPNLKPLWLKQPMSVCICICVWTFLNEFSNSSAFY